jgi:predicted dehydrogenase
LSRLRVIIAGAGLMGAWHARYARRAGAEVVSVVDPDPARAQSVARANGCRVVLRDLRDAPSSQKAEVLHICVPTEGHEPLVEQALDRRWHVLAEKPLVESAAATKRILDAARVAGVLVCPVHQFPFQRGVQAVQEKLPRLGSVRHVDSVACSAGADGRDPRGRDQVVLDILPHPLSLFVALLAARVDGTQWSVQRPNPGELRASCAAGGATLSILVSMAGRPTRNTVRIVAERGTAHVDLFHGFAVVEAGDVSKTRKITRPFTLAAGTLVKGSTNLIRRSLVGQPAYPGLEELIRLFYGAVQGTGPMPISYDETLQVARARDAIRASLS